MRVRVRVRVRMRGRAEGGLTVKTTTEPSYEEGNSDSVVLCCVVLSCGLMSEE